MRLATAAGVAKELDTTVAKLNAAYSDAQKAQAKARVDEAARRPGTSPRSTRRELKAQIDAATFPGFGAGGTGGPRRSRRPGGPGGGLGLGLRPAALGSRSSERLVVLVDDDATSLALA